MTTSITFKILVISGFALTLAACGGENENSNSQNNPPIITAEYEIRITNTTNNQPLSPPAVIAQNSSQSHWEIGQSASDGLEILAESGSPSEFVDESAVAISSVSGDSPIGPGSQMQLSITAPWSADLSLTVATMLVNTNDAFTGVDALPIGSLALGDSIRIFTPVYDAGTEFNSETDGTVPGPANGGEGYNLERETSGTVTRHPGVVTQAGNYNASVLNESHRFDNGAMLLVIERTL